MFLNLKKIFTVLSNSFILNFHLNCNLKVDFLPNNYLILLGTHLTNFKQL